MEHFRILNGDHRKELVEAAKNGGLNACLAYFKSNKHLMNKYSEPEDIRERLIESLKKVKTHRS